MLLVLLSGSKVTTRLGIELTPGAAGDARAKGPNLANLAKHAVLEVETTVFDRESAVWEIECPIFDMTCHVAKQNVHFGWGLGLSVFIGCTDSEVGELGVHDGHTFTLVCDFENTSHSAAAAINCGVRSIQKGIAVVRVV